MITTIDNNRRKFLVQSQGFGSQKDIFCNLDQIPTVLKEAFQEHEDFKVFEYWNSKLKGCSKKHLNQMFLDHKVNFKIK